MNKDNERINYSSSSFLIFYFYFYFFFLFIFVFTIDAIEFYDFYVCHTHKMSHIETSIIYDHTYQFAIHV